MSKLSSKELFFEKDDLPKGWVRTTVGTIYRIIGGGTPSTKVENYWKGDIPWITSADIHSLYSIIPRKYITNDAIKNSATNLIPEDSIIVVTRVGLGKIVLTKNPICFSQDSQALLGNNLIVYSHYALYFLSQVIQIFKYVNRGTTISGVTKKQLSELSFSLPPLNEQKRIVTKIESIFSQIDACREKLDDVKKLLKQNKQSILKQSFDNSKWDYVRLGDRLTLEYGGGLSSKNRKKGIIPVLGSTEIIGYHDKALVKILH